MSGPKFPSVLAKLAAWRAEVLEPLPDAAAREAGVKLKLEIEEAIGCPEWCSKYGVRRDSQVAVLPDAILKTQYSEYRIVEDQDMDDRRWWIEVSVDGEPLRPPPGALVVENRPRRSRTPHRPATRDDRTGS